VVAPYTKENADVVVLALIVLAVATLLYLSFPLLLWLVKLPFRILLWPFSPRRKKVRVVSGGVGEGLLVCLLGTERVTLPLDGRSKSGPGAGRHPLSRQCVPLSSSINHVISPPYTPST
jgi:hypothetical protein